MEVQLIWNMRGHLRAVCKPEAVQSECARTLGVSVGNITLQRVPPRKRSTTKDPGGLVHINFFQEISGLHIMLKSDPGTVVLQVSP